MSKQIVTYREEFRLGTKWNQDPDKSYRYLECSECGQMTTTSDSVVSVICFLCINEKCNPPVIKQKVSSGRPRGWHLMEQYVDKDGNVFNKGKELPDLKDKFSPTKIKEKVKRSKAQKRKIIDDASQKAYALKKKLNKASTKKDKALFIREIKKYNKIISGKIPDNYVL